MMGEGAECRPLVIIRGADDIEFGNNFSYEDIKMPKEKDFFAELYKTS